MRTLTAIAILLFVTITTGCGKDFRPKDLPKLYPCKITVMQEGKPLAGVAVTLTNTDPSAKYATASGESGADGVAVLRIYGEDGVPEGTYKIRKGRTKYRYEKR